MARLVTWRVVKRYAGYLARRKPLKVRMRPAPLGKGHSPPKAKEHATAAKAETACELAAWRKFDVFEQVAEGAPSKASAGNCRFLAWKTAVGRAEVWAHSVAKDLQNPDSEAGAAETAGYANLKSSHLLAISLGAV